LTVCAYAGRIQTRFDRAGKKPAAALRFPVFSPEIRASIGGFRSTSHLNTRYDPKGSESMSQRPLNVGLIGGGGGAFIVQPHQKAIHFDGTRRVTVALHPNPSVAMDEPAGGLAIRAMRATTR
jgi:hypothetical protein